MKIFLIRVCVALLPSMALAHSDELDPGRIQVRCQVPITAPQGANGLPYVDCGGKLLLALGAPVSGLHKGVLYDCTPSRIGQLQAVQFCRPVAEQNQQAKQK